MRIPPDKVDEIYRAMDIVEIVGDYAALKKKGVNYWALSPFVKEKSPSFAVNPAKGIYKCFSSGKGGNAVSFLMEIEGYSYPEALLHIAKKYNIEVAVTEAPAEYEQARSKIESLYILNQYASDFYHNYLLENEEGKTIGLSYFKERGITEATIKTFQLGYAPDAWEKLAQDAHQKQYVEEYLVETGLCTRSEKTGKLIDRFRARVMFPITNPVGKVVGFGGRILGIKDKEAKYINSPESPVYQKSHVLFGLFQGRNAIREKNLCILTEGYMDVVALHQSGIQNVVASSGTSLTEEQVKLIRRFTKNVLLLYDGDEPGVKAAMRGIDILISEGLAVRALILPDNHDPDSYTKQYGAAAFLAYIEKHSLDFMDFKIQRLQQNADNSPRAQAERLQTLAQTLIRIPDLVEQQLYIRDTAHKLNIEEDLMEQAIGQAKKVIHQEELRDLRRNNQTKPAEVIEMKTFERLDLATQEKELLRVLVNHYDKTCEKIVIGVEEKQQIALISFYKESLNGLLFENPLYESIKNDIFERSETSAGFNLNHYINQSDAQICNLISELLTPTHSLSEHWKDYDMMTPSMDENLTLAMEDAVLYYKYNKVDKLIRETKEKLKTPQNEEEEHQLLEMFLYLRQMQSEIEKLKAIEGAKNAADVR